MFEKRKAIPVKDAVQQVMQFSRLGEKEYVSIDDCDGRYLGDDIIADHDIPRFDRSPYDGFAIRSVDTQTASQGQAVEFEVVDHIGAGAVSKVNVQKFQAVRIMTGAQLPESCDAVVMFEVTQQFERDGKPFMTLKRKVKPLENVSIQGSEVQRGTVIIRKGQSINPGIKAVLATFGYGQVPVIKRPKIGVYATGTELLDVDEPLVEGKIRNSNSYMITSQIKRLNAESVYYGKLADDFDLCFAAVKNALEEVDLLITTGGVSVGDYDFLPEIYQKLGAKVLFNKIMMRPGSVTTVAEWNGKLLFGLSGNPSACYVGFELYVRPIIRSFYHSNKPHLRKTSAILDADFPKPNPFTRFVRSRIDYKNGQVYVVPSGLDKSNVVTSLADADALMVLPGGTRGYQKGDQVEALILEDQVGSEWPWN